MSHQENAIKTAAGIHRTQDQGYMTVEVRLTPHPQSQVGQASIPSPDAVLGVEMALRDGRWFTRLVVKDMAAMLRRARGRVYYLGQHDSSATSRKVSYSAEILQRCLCPGSRFDVDRAIDR